MKIRWSRQAEQDRADIMDYIAADNIRAAIAMDELFGSAAERLSEFPMLGKPGQIAGTRELVVHESYRLIYEVDTVEQTVSVLTLVHTARRWPPVR